MRALGRVASIRLPPLVGTISLETMRISSGCSKVYWEYYGLCRGPTLAALSPTRNSFARVCRMPNPTRVGFRNRKCVDGDWEGDGSVSLVKQPQPAWRLLGDDDDACRRRLFENFREK